MELKNTALEIIKNAIKSVLPDNAVKEELKKRSLPEKVYLVAIGKAAWRMAKAAHEILGRRIVKGIVITKYGHSEGEIEGIEIYEAGHPLPDENTLLATKKVLNMVDNLDEKDFVLFLVSGGGSALFELPLPGVELKDIMEISDALMKAGADIYELNTVRKHLSSVKGGRFAEKVYPAKILALVLSDVLGDRLDMIASGPAYPDLTTSEDALSVLEKYNIKVDERIINAIKKETPKDVKNAKHIVVGNVVKVCEKAKELAENQGFNAEIFTTLLQGEAREAGKFISSIIKEIKEFQRPLKRPAAIIFGGETTVTVKGRGKGGRNQEMALSVAIEIAGMEGIVFASVGTDGTDGPTDAAGGIVDGMSVKIMKNNGVDTFKYLENNDSYNALKVCDGLVITGPTGTNVNDLSFALIL